MKRRYLQIILAAVLFLLALGLTLYPVVSNYYNQRHQSQIQTAYREVLKQTDTAELKRIREQAFAYNAAITPGAVEEAYSQEAILTASNNYVNQLDVGGSGIMGYIDIPKIHVDLPIYHGTGTDSLDRGTGHLLPSSRRRGYPCHYHGTQWYGIPENVYRSGAASRGRCVLPSCAG